MPCYHPLKGYQSREARINGKKSPVVFSPPARDFTVVMLPCGQCVGCRLERSRQWAMRCIHEASLYENNCFITLTYNDENLPYDGSLNKKHFQDFMKRLRKKFSESPIRYFHCGEYGEKNGRPHYHACLFNFDFLDRKFFKEHRGSRLYVSETLDMLWQEKGFCSIGEVTFESAAYVARYIMKKVTGDEAAKHYERVDTNTGEIINLVPEYTTMSRRPGIGKEWFERFHGDVFPSDSVIVRGRRCKPPRYYDGIYEISDPEEYERLKRERREKLNRIYDDTSPRRLRARETVKKAQVEFLKRSL